MTDIISTYPVSGYLIHFSFGYGYYCKCECSFTSRSIHFPLDMVITPRHKFGRTRLSYNELGPRNQSKIRRVVETNMIHLQEQLVSSNADKHFFKDMIIDTINKKYSTNISTNIMENKVIHQLLLTYRNQYNDKSIAPYAKYTSLSALTDAITLTMIFSIMMRVTLYIFQRTYKIVAVL